MAYLGAVVYRSQATSRRPVIAKRMGAILQTPKCGQTQRRTERAEREGRKVPDPRHIDPR